MVLDTEGVAFGSQPDRSVALPPCLYCSGEAYERLFDNVEDRLKYVPGRWAFCRCRQCGSAMLASQPPAKELSAFYPPVYGFTPELAQQGLASRLVGWLEHRWFFSFQYAAQVRRVLRWTGWPSGQGKRMLDVGCGRGLRLLAFRRHGFEVQGVDFQPEAVDYLQQRLAIPAVCAAAGDLVSYFPAASFDLITAFYVLEHLSDVQSAVEACYHLLRPGGWLAAAVPLVDCVQGRLFRSRWPNASEAPRHLSLPSQEGIRRVFVRAGFEKIAVVPDAVLTCAGLVALSVVPGAATTHVYGSRRGGAMLRRLAGGLITLLALPGCLVENHLLRRPPLGIVLGHRPKADDTPKNPSRSTPATTDGR